MLQALLAFAVFSLVVIFSFTLLVMVMAEFMMNQEFFFGGGLFLFPSAVERLPKALYKKG